MAKIPANLKFNKEGLIPAIAQDARTGDVLMMAYMNRAALRRTLETGFAHYYSRSRGRLWKKGEESGHLQRVGEIRLDCDGDVLLLQVEQDVAACHLGYRSCFFRQVKRDLIASPPVLKQVFRPEAAYGASSQILDAVYRTILDRKVRRPPGSYVASLYEKGEDQILKKIAEEASEVLLSAKRRSREELIYEVADLWFHTMVLLGARGIPLAELWKELQGRVGKQKAEYIEKRTGKRQKKR
ncbi:MAG: bifunctional phosphoribosyl-AMP cyclohydrolase/phosphoribosyl-ATP diphosphatase HisIE [Candidatus Methylomirabilales bacterium]